MMINDEDEDESGGGGEACPNLVVLLFHSPCGKLMDLLLGFLCGRETYHKTTTLSLPLFVVALKNEFKKWV